MKNKNLWLIIFIIFDTIIAAIVIFYFINKDNNPVNMTDIKCLQNYHTEKIYWTGSNEYTDMLHNQDAFLASDEVNLVYDNPNFYTKNQELLIWKSIESTWLVVNKKYFSDLQQIDLTRFSNIQTVWTFKDLNFESLSPKQMFEFLINSQILGTFIHIEANICMLNETDSADLYEATFQAEHIYYTNDRNIDSYSFTFTIDKITWKITVSSN